MKNWLGRTRLMLKVEVQRMCGGYKLDKGGTEVLFYGEVENVSLTSPPTDEGQAVEAEALAKKGLPGDEIKARLVEGRTCHFRLVPPPQERKHCFVAGDLGQQLFLEAYNATIAVGRELTAAEFRVVADDWLDFWEAPLREYAWDADKHVSTVTLDGGREAVVDLREVWQRVMRPEQRRRDRPE